MCRVVFMVSMSENSDLGIQAGWLNSSSCDLRHLLFVQSLFLLCRGDYEYILKNFFAGVLDVMTSCGWNIDKCRGNKVLLYLPVNQGAALAVQDYKRFFIADGRVPPNRFAGL
jgi:hypothetical protein